MLQASPIPCTQEHLTLPRDIPAPHLSPPSRRRTQTLRYSAWVHLQPSQNKKLPAALSRFDSSSDALPGASDGEVLVFFQRKERNGDLDLERTLRRDSLLAGVGAEQTEQERTNSEHCR